MYFLHGWSFGGMWTFLFWLIRILSFWYYIILFSWSLINSSPLQVLLLLKRVWFIIKFFVKSQISPLIYITLLFIAGILLETCLHISLFYKAICILVLLSGEIICLRKERIPSKVFGVIGIILLYCLTIPISMMYAEIYSSFHKPDIHGRDVAMQRL